MKASALAIARSPAALATPAALRAGAQGPVPQAGEKKAAMCIGCHGIPGYQASFPEVHKVPMIAGQNAKYIAAALAPTRRASASTRRCAASPRR